MRVLVTGATGFVGGHTARALSEAGHSLRVLVRDPARIDATLGPLGVQIYDHVVGDMTDSDAVERALEGCEAVVHCAAVVSLKRAQAEEVARVNPLGTRIVMDAAMKRDIDPIVVVSSASALKAHEGDRLRVDDPARASGSPYERSKAESVRLARQYQADGAPITLTFPGGVVGAPVGGAFGETGAALAAHMRLGSLPVPTAAMPIVDVRDVAAIHAALIEPGKGPRSYLCGGRTVTMTELAVIYRKLTGRRFPVLRVPGGAMRFTGRTLDALARVFPIDTVMTSEAMEHFTRWIGSDDEGIESELGITYRPLTTTLADTLRGLRAAGLVSARQIGRLATDAR
jgi:nucleoside-diphosphate-sugar epimerase